MDGADLVVGNVEAGRGGQAAELSGWEAASREAAQVQVGEERHVEEAVLLKSWGNW